GPLELNHDQRQRGERNAEENNRKMDDLFFGNWFGFPFLPGPVLFPRLHRISERAGRSGGLGGGIKGRAGKL
ncbi:MAG: hypothetical protein NTY64_18700, partial [Deltaproteobacteria bacterium]|nr:hypothetical protein [Deltaproteobacteria bacterium]